MYFHDDSRIQKPDKKRFICLKYHGLYDFYQIAPWSLRHMGFNGSDALFLVGHPQLQRYA